MIVALWGLLGVSAVLIALFPSYRVPEDKRDKLRSVSNSNDWNSVRIGFGSKEIILDHSAVKSKPATPASCVSFVEYPTIVYQESITS